MIDTVTRIADRVLARIAPRVEANAGCSYQSEYCYCIYHVGYYTRQCMYGCSQVPDHCYGCTRTSSC